MFSLSTNRCLLFLVALITIVLSGCYTLLKHPSTEYAEMTDFSRCSECHNDYYMVNSYNPYYSGPWWDYYSVPWWYNNLLVVTEEGEEIPMRKILSDRNTQRRGISPSPGVHFPSTSTQGSETSSQIPILSNTKDSETNRVIIKKKRTTEPSKKRVIDRGSSSNKQNDRSSKRKDDRSGDNRSSRRNNSDDNKNNSSREKRKK